MKKTSKDINKYEKEKKRTRKVVANMRRKKKSTGKIVINMRKKKNWKFLVMTITEKPEDTLKKRRR